VNAKNFILVAQQRKGFSDSSFSTARQYLKDLTQTDEIVLDTLIKNLPSTYLELKEKTFADKP